MRLINQKPGRVLSLFLLLVPFALVLLAYKLGSDARLAVNPQDKLLPALSTLMETGARLVSEESRRTGEILFWKDTWSSLTRLGLGVGIASLIGLIAGLAIGLLPYMRAGLAGFVAVVSMVPPLAVLPILFIVFGLGEVSKVALIVIGITPFLIRDLSARTLELPTEQITKAQTLGASSMAIALRVALPQIMPRLLQAVRLSPGPAWLFRIAAEAIASEDGLGYRIFLVRRFLAMDVILVYVVWITLLAFAIDYALKVVSRKLYPWTEAGL